MVVVEWLRRLCWVFPPLNGVETDCEHVEQFGLGKVSWSAFALRFVARLLKQIQLGQEVSSSRNWNGDLKVLGGGVK